MFLLAWNLLRGRVGRALVAIRDHPIAATAMGINLPMFKSLTFGVSAAFTGVAGALGGDRRGLRLAGQLHRRSCRSSCWWAWWSAGWRRSGARSSAPSSSSSCRTSPTRCRSRRRPPSTASADRPDVPDAHRRDGHPAQGFGRLRRRVTAGIAGQRQPALSSCIDDQQERRHEQLRISAWRSRAWRRRRRSSLGAGAEEVRHRRQRQGDQDRPHQPVLGPGLGLRHASARRSRRTSTRSTPKAASTAARSTFITLDDGYNPAKTVEQARKLVEQDEVLLLFQPLGTPSNTAIHKYMNQQEGAATVRRHRRHQVGRSEELPVDDGLAAELPVRGEDLRGAPPGDQARTPRSACSTRTTTTARTT